MDQNPARGNNPARAAEAITKVQKVMGMCLRRPPMSFFMSKLWWDPLWLTEPAPRNRSALKKAWVNRWKMAACHAPTPRAITMYPSWLTVE